MALARSLGGAGLCHVIQAIDFSEIPVAVEREFTDCIAEKSPRTRVTLARGLTTTTAVCSRHLLKWYRWEECRGGSGLRCGKVPTVRLYLQLAKPQYRGGDDTGAWEESSAEGLNTTWVYEYTDKLGVMSYHSKDYLLTVN
jgi:hypothetical protein